MSESVDGSRSTPSVDESHSRSKAKSNDPGWKYAYWPDPTDKNTIKCELCGFVSKGGIKRQKQHLIGGFGDVAKCPNTNTTIATELYNYMMGNKKKKPQIDFQMGREEQEAEDNSDDEGEGQVRNKGDASNPNVIDLTKKRKAQTRGPLDTYVRKNPEEVVDMRRKGIYQTTMENRYKKEDQKKVDQFVARWFYMAGIPFNVARLKSFEVMCEAIGQFGSGYKPPSIHKLRKPLLEAEVKNTKLLHDEYKASWKTYGCTLMCDGWTDKRGRHLINFLVNCPDGTYFIESIDTSDKREDAQLIFQLLDKHVEQIGEEYVAQVVTDNASANVAAGSLLMEKRKTLYWSPCVAHCLDLMLEDICKMKKYKKTISQARSITSFIYSHSRLLEAMRKMTNRRDIVRCGVTRFASAFLTLQSLYTFKDKLRQLFVSDSWNNSLWARQIQGKKIANIILAVEFWHRVEDCLRASQPLVQVLRLVDGDEIPAMGYIYAAMEKAREKIVDNFGNKERDYKPILGIIDRRWETQMHRPLHAAGYFLNPTKYFPAKEDDPQIVAKFESAFLECLQRMVRDHDIQDKISDQMELYMSARGLFGSSLARRHRDRKLPVEWWRVYGAETPELRSLALRILGLCCTSSACERNWSTFEFIHTKKRNRLEHKRLNDLVYVQYNWRLKERFKERKMKPEKYDPICFDDLDWSSEWMTGKSLDDDLVRDTTDLRWADVDVALGASEILDGPNRPRRTRVRRSGTNSALPQSSYTLEDDLEGNEDDGEEQEWVHAEADTEDDSTDLNEDESDEEDDDNIDQREGDCGDPLAGASLDGDMGFGIQI